MLSYFTILPQLIFGHFLYLFRAKALNPKLYYASVCLFSKHTFRLPESAKNDLLLIPRQYFLVIKNIIKNKPKFNTLPNTSDNAILDSNFSAEQKRLDYLNFFKVSGRIFLSAEDLSGSYNLFESIIHLFFVSLGFLFILPLSFSSHRVNYALLLQEIPDLVNLLKILRSNKVTRLYQFCIYEKDANFMAYILDQHRIKVSKITSEVPITFANKIIIADEINLCFAYQKEEVEAYKESLFFNALNVWVPEMQITYLQQYQNKTFSLPKNTIGFYSSAFWLRKQLNHSIADVGSYDAEEHLLVYTKEYLEIHPSMHLIIFTHPYEKRTPEQYEKTLIYYKTLLGEELLKRITLTDKSDNSVLLFHTINLGISVFSTIIFERLGIGFKSILAPLDKKDFPLVTSPFRNISAYSKEEYFLKLNENIPLSKNDFFRLNKIENYISPYIKIDCELA